MPIVTIFSGLYCSGEEIAAETARQFNLQPLAERLLEETSSRYKIKPAKLLKAMMERTPNPSKLSKDRRQQISWLRRTLADFLIEDNLLLHGFASHLIPLGIPQLLRVCLIANHDYRVTVGAALDKISAKEAAQKVKKADELSFEWVQLLRYHDPWDDDLYDIVIPMHETSVEQAVTIIGENLAKDAVKLTDYGRATAQDFILAAEAAVVLNDKGHDVAVTAERGRITIILNTYTLRLEQYENELKELVRQLNGVKEVNVKVGPRYNPPSINPMGSFELPPRMLLVDDEKDFVHTLSERLQTRDLQTAVVYDGEEALSYVNTDDPEVIVLDLKMPGIDGLEVLRRVKRTHPHVEVIILTGHGSDRERDIALELGAFAYLQKPANIDMLAETMKQAYQKVRENKLRMGKA